MHSYLRIGITTLAVPLAGLAAWLYHLRRTLSQTTTSSHSRRLPSTETQQQQQSSYPISLPPDVAAADSPWIIAHERVLSDPVPRTVLPQEDLLLAYTRAAHVAFGRTPNAFAVRSMLQRSEPARQSFDESWIRASHFAVGDRINGAYTVSYHGEGRVPGSERVELALDPPASYSGPRPRGVIIAEVLPAPGSSDHVVFVNESWMWRRDDEKPTLVETSVGGWLHDLMARWLVVQGIAELKGQKEKHA
ncbi:hypothetical protein B0I35DRAFT_69904 [Stachybotrys elegans]|uniref:Uncharacterized protein n=1 Tax=Stachybotrys elegans TaxID=80388 RepID=A0A8K0SJ95_9HYPO|nr:hypothetical protein B0I35DRAFT_69904 [Stachybotrys elegans]